MTSGITKAPAYWSGFHARCRRDRADAAGHAGVRHGVRRALCAKAFHASRGRSDDGLRLWRAVAVRRGAVVAGKADAVVDRDAGALDRHGQHPFLADERHVATVVLHAAAAAGLSADVAGHPR